MNYLHAELKIGPEDIVEVILDKEANVHLLNDNNYYYYQNELKYDSYGGLAKSSPVHISPSEDGQWHLVIDLGEHGGTMKPVVKLPREKRIVDMVWLCTENTRDKKKAAKLEEGAPSIWQRLFPSRKK